MVLEYVLLVFRVEASAMGESCGVVSMSGDVGLCMELFFVVVWNYV